MSEKALVVGGCPAPYHRLEPIEPILRSHLESLGLEVTVTGIYHPEGGDAFVGDYSVLTADNLAQYHALILSTTGKQRFGADVDAIVNFVKGGGALIGIHNAADSFTDHADYVSLIGARFRTHPAQLDITAEIVDSDHPVTRHVASFIVHDELYLFADYDPANVHLLAQTRSFDDNGPVPLAWTRTEGSGRVFYLSLGHNPSTMQDPDWTRLFLNGVTWALRPGDSA